MIELRGLSKHYRLSGDVLVKAVDKVRIFPHDLMGLRIYIVSLKPEIYEQRGKLTLREGHLPNREEKCGLHSARGCL